MSHWTVDDDIKLIETCRKATVIDWNCISSTVFHCLKTPDDCSTRWAMFNAMLHKSKYRMWTVEEDRMLIETIARYGHKPWSKISEYLINRSAKQCRERYSNHLCPSINKSPLHDHEKKIIKTFHELHGGKWSALSKLLPGRTPNMLKNYHASQKRKTVKLRYTTPPVVPTAIPVDTVPVIGYLPAPSIYRYVYTSHNTSIHPAISL